MNDQRDAQQAPAAGLEHVDFRLLGPLEVRVGAAPVQLGPPKQRALLAHLLLRANEAIPVEQLVDALWPDDPPPSARHAVQVYVSRLRRLLQDAGRIEAHSRAYVLRADPEEVDLSRFRRLVADAREALAGEDAATAAALLDAALALWRDRALADLKVEPGVRELVLELEEERLAALELRVAAKLEAGESADLIAELEQLIGDYPAREELHADLMLALHRAGRPGEALDAYRRAEEALQNELGLEPSARLRELEAGIRREDPALIPDAPELRVRRHLPTPPNQFIGRERELDELVELIADRGLRLVTLTGTGGIGKTRLALAAAERLLADFEDGVWFVDLSALSHPDDVAPAVAQTLGVTAADRGVQEAIEAHLADKRLLLVFDNFEHVAAAAPWLSPLLRRAAQLVFLATSRSPLHVPDEHEYNVPPLAAFEAVRLLVARARAVSRRFELTDANAAPIADICVALEGLPLAIELAGATLKRFSPAELRSQLERSVHALVRGPLDAPPRQQTIRATIEWSHGLLGMDEQQLLARLAVFRGGWTSEAAGAVCGATDDSLASLREQGLINSNGERFSMLTTIREFAVERLSPRELRTIARKHADFFTSLAESADVRAYAHGRSLEFLDDLGRDYENLRAALRWTHESGDGELFARLAGALGQYWHSRGPYAEARRWLEAAFAAEPEDASVRAHVAFSLGIVCVQDGDYRRGQIALGEALALFRRIGDREMEGRCLGNLGQAAVRLGEFDRAREHLTESQRVARDLGNDLMLGRIVNALGVLEMMEQRFDEAAHWYGESLVISKRARDREGTAIAALNLAHVALLAGHLDEATARYREGLRLGDELQHHVLMASSMLGLAWVAERSADLVRSAHLLGASEAVRKEVGAELNPFERPRWEDCWAAVRAGLGEEDAAEAYEAGRSQDRNDALAYALQE